MENCSDRLNNTQGKEIKDSIKISKSKLTLTLIDLGYTCITKKIGDNRRVLYYQ